MSNSFFIEPSNQTFAELMGNSVKYEVPHFQRDYSWEREQWEDLWNDIEDLKNGDKHYMGYAVLQKKDDYLYEIIDGQQRFVTLTMIILASMAKLKILVEKGIEAQDNTERLRELENRFIGTKNIITLTIEPRLTLNRNNKQYFKRICEDLEPANPRNIPKTNQHLKNAFLFFKSKINYPGGEDIARFIESFSTSLVFTKIVVQDSLNAYKVFETLNARGVMLSTPDLIKNYIFSTVTHNNTVTDQELDDMDDRWSSIVSQLGEHNFTDYIRYLYNSQFFHTTKKDLFKSIRGKYTKPKEAAAYLKELENFAPIYASLLSPYDSWWDDLDDEYKKAQNYLVAFELFGIKQVVLVLMAAFMKFSAIEFVLLAKYLYVLSIRYNIICNDSPNEQEIKYNKMAIKINNGEYKRASNVKNGDEFKELYPDDARFKNQFQAYKMPSRRSSKKIRFLLAQIENQLGKNLDYNQVSLEHICPYNPESDWVKYFGDGAFDVSDRLGNMVLLDRDDLGQADFKTKQEAYQKTGNKLAMEVSTYSEWNVESVNKYQTWLAEQAVQTWRAD